MNSSDLMESRLQRVVAAAREAQEGLPEVAPYDDGQSRFDAQPQRPLPVAP